MRWIQKNLFLSHPPDPPLKVADNQNINEEQIRLIPSLMLRPLGFNTYILRNEVLSGYPRVSKRIEVWTYIIVICCELKILDLSSPGDSSSLFRGVAYHGSLPGYTAHEIFVPHECASSTTLGTWEMMLIHKGLARSTPSPGKVFAVIFPNNVPLLP